MSQNNVHRHSLIGIIFACVLLVSITLASATVFLVALLRDDTPDADKNDDTQTQDGDDDSDKDENGKDDGDKDGEDDKDTDKEQNNKPTSVKINNTEVFFGPLLQLDDEHPYTRPVEELVTRGEMKKLPYSQLLSKYGFISLSAGHDGNFFLKDNNLFLDKNAGEALREMMADYVAETGIKNIQVRNAYYYDKSEDIASTPDVNEALLNPHAMGTAIDLEIRHITDSGEIKLYPLRTAFHLYNTPQYYEWFVSNCHKYGFIYTGDDPSYSSFRYIGNPHATYIQNDGANFDYYLGLVREKTSNDRLVITGENGGEWWVYYVKASEGETTDIPVFGSKYTISGDNVGGFIVTVDVSGI